MSALCQSLIIALALYSIIPMPKVDWQPANIRFALAFLPLVGVLIGFCEWLWFVVGSHLQLNESLLAVVALIIPVAISGGIHLDGFCDTVDALSSHQSAKRKLEIMKDPHIGAFALIGCVFYLLLAYALWLQLFVDEQVIYWLSSGFVLSRALGALLLISLLGAKREGLGATFAQGAQTKTMQFVLGTYILLGLVWMAMLNLSATGIYLVLQLLFLGYYYRMVRREFGGMTGDLAGYWVMCSEMLLLLAMVIMEVISR